MKKPSKWLSLCLVLAMMLSVITVGGVSAAEGELAFELNQSAFDASAENGSARGLTDAVGSDNTIQLWCAYKPGYGSPATRLVQNSFTNLTGGETDYFTMHWDGPNDGKASRRLAVALPSLANKSITAEYWMQYVDIQWSSLLAIRPIDGAESAAQSAYVNAVGNQKTVQLRANMSKDDTPYALDNGTWHHVVLQRELEEVDGAIKTTAKLYVDGAYRGSNSGTAAAIEETAAYVYAGAYTASEYCPTVLSLAGLKVYEGALSAETVAAHYAAEKDTYTPATAPTINLQNSEAYAFSPSFVLTSDGALNADSLEAGISLTDAEGAAVTTAKALSEDGKTVTVTAENAAEGSYTLAVTEALKAAQSGLGAVSASYPVTICALNRAADFSALGFMADEDKRVSDVSAVFPWITGNATGSGTNSGGGIVTVDGENNLTYRDPIGAAGLGSMYYANLWFNTGAAVPYGLLELDMSLKGNVTKVDSGFRLVGTNNTNGAWITDGKGTITGLNTESYVPLHFEIYAKDTASDWQVRIYNAASGSVLAEKTFTRSEIGDVSSVRLLQYFDNGNRFALTFKNNSLAMRWSATNAKFSGVTPADGAEIYTSGTDFTVLAATTIDAGSVSGKVRLQNAAGEIVTSEAAVSGNAITLSASRLAPGAYTLVVDEGILTADGTAFPSLSASYTARDMAAEESPLSWGYTIGEEKTAAELTAKAELLSGTVPSGNGWQTGTFIVNEDGSITFRYLPSGGFQSSMDISSKAPIRSGYAKLNVSIDMKRVERAGYEYKLQVTGDSDGTQQKVSEIELLNGEGGLYFDVPKSAIGGAEQLNNTHQIFNEGGAAALGRDADGYASLSFELYRASEADPWFLTVTNTTAGAVLLTDIIPTDELGYLTGLSVYHYKGTAGASDLTFKDISILYSADRVLGPVSINGLSVEDEFGVTHTAGTAFAKDAAYAWTASVANCTKPAKVVAVVYTKDNKPAAEIKLSDFEPNAEMATQSISGIFIPTADDAATVKIMLLDMKTLKPLAAAAVH